MIDTNRKTNYGVLINLLSHTTEMLDWSRAISLFYHAMQCQSVPGDVVEFGCNRGHTAKILTAILNKKLWVYDSFEGLPHWTQKDGPPALAPGELKVSVEELTANFEHDGLPVPVITKAWFKDIRPDQLPGAIAFAHLDGDLYQSTLDALEKVWPRMSQGAVCIVDDYRDPSWPGVATAILDFALGGPGLYKLDQPWGTHANRTTHAVLTKL